MGDWERNYARDRTSERDSYDALRPICMAEVVDVKRHLRGDRV